MRHTTTKQFERLLARLSLEPDEAGTAYLVLRSKLEMFFHRHGLPSAEDLADETLDRVAEKAAIQEIDEIWAYTFGVARFVAKEAYKRPNLYVPEEYAAGVPAEIREVDPRVEALQKVLSALSDTERELLLSYYSFPESWRSPSLREELAKERGMSIAILRVKIQRIRKRVVRDVLQMLESKVDKNKA